MRNQKGIGIRAILNKVFFNQGETLETIIESARLYRASLFENLLFEADEINSEMEIDSLTQRFDPSCFGNFVRNHITTARVENGMVYERSFRYSMILLGAGQNDAVVYNCVTEVRRCGDQSKFPGMVEYTTFINGLPAERFLKDIRHLSGYEMNLRVSSIQILKTWTRAECKPEINFAYISNSKRESA